FEHVTAMSARAGCRARLVAAAIAALTVARLHACLAQCAGSAWARTRVPRCAQSAARLGSLLSDVSPSLSPSARVRTHDGGHIWDERSSNVCIALGRIEGCGASDRGGACWHDWCLWAGGFSTRSDGHYQRDHRRGWYSPCLYATDSERKCRRHR